MKVNRKMIKIDEDLCTGCGECIISCAEGALEIVDGKARLVGDKYCDGLGACLGECPEGALTIEEREAEDFDEEAVHERLDELKHTDVATEQTMPCGCPSAMVQSFAPQTACQTANEPVSHASQASALTHWPVQIMLVPPTAPFLKNADLVVASDCTPIAYPNFHRDFLEGKVVMIGCPKFDDTQAYVEKFAGIFAHASIRSVTVVVMEVPCCGGLPYIVKRGMETAGRSVPMEQVIVSTRGEILRKEKLVA
ncbi:MAG: 4Fe-4S dicluster domain-containing protein [Desulfomonilaceae bacterium]|nr:4Fe-4S dicluster domain-containing protein [Desulfomonilaceae bacterium]